MEICNNSFPITHDSEKRFLGLETSQTYVFFRLKADIFFFVVVVVATDFRKSLRVVFILY